MSKDGLKTFYVSLAIDARVDVKIQAASLEEAMQAAVHGNYDIPDLDTAEIVETTPVNISDADGTLLEDF